MTTRFHRVNLARERVEAERSWVEDHGASLAGYIERYGEADDPDRHGDGGAAIFWADMAALREAEAAYRRVRGEAA